MNIRERAEEKEYQNLSPYASFSRDSRGRERLEMECDIRTVYQRDRDRIIPSKAFRRLKDKTQVFLAAQGDHYRTLSEGCRTGWRQEQYLGCVTLCGTGVPETRKRI